MRTTRLFRDTGKPVHLPLRGLGMVGFYGLHGVVGPARGGGALHHAVTQTRSDGRLQLNGQTSPWLRNPSPASITWGSPLWSNSGTG